MALVNVLEALAIADGISQNELVRREYERKVLSRLNKYTPQLHIRQRKEQALKYIATLEQRLRVIQYHSCLHPSSILYIDQHMLLFDGIIRYEKKYPLLAEAHLVRFNDREAAFCWIASADLTTVTFPDGTSSDIHAGLRIIQPLIQGESISIEIIDSNAHTSFRHFFRRTDMISIWDNDFVQDYILHWLGKYGITYEYGILPMGSIFDGVDVSYRSYKYRDEVGGDETPYSVPIIPPFDFQMAHVTAASIKEEYGRSYCTMHQLVLYTSPLYATTSDVDYYVPIVNRDINLISQWCDGYMQDNNGEVHEVNQEPIPFRVAVEFLLRMRIEYGNPAINVFGYGCQGNYRGTFRMTRIPSLTHRQCFGDTVTRHRIIELKAYYKWIEGGRLAGTGLMDWLEVENEVDDEGAEYFDVALGSSTFWHLLKEIDEYNSSGLQVLKENIPHEKDAELIYSAWTSVCWEEFWDYFLLIGLRPESVCRNFRKILHLSDLHLGKNDSSNEKQALDTIVSQIQNTYGREKIKPLIVITGDLVDYGGKIYFDWAKETLLPLLNQGYLVIFCPGNHDYSGQVNAVELSPFLSTAIPAIAFLFNVFIAWMAQRGGYDRHKITGIDLDQDSLINFNRFFSWVYPEGGVKSFGLNKNQHYREFFIRPIQSLELFALDLNDGTSNHPSWALQGLIADKDIFMHDESLRFAKGWADKFSLRFLDDWIDNADLERRFHVLATHYWMNYFPNYRPSSRTELALLLIGQARDHNFNGSEVPDAGPVGTRFRNTLLKLCMGQKILSAKRLHRFIDAVATSYGVTGSITYDVVAELYGQTIDDGVTLIDNSTLNDQHENHKIVNESSMEPRLHLFDMIMVGHRHLEHFQDFAKSIEMEINAYSTRVKDGRQYALQYSQVHCYNFICSMGLFSRNYGQSINIIRDEIATALANLMVDSDTLSFDSSNVYEKLKNKYCGYYSESYSSTNENGSWVELKINLLTGHVVKKNYVS